MAELDARSNKLAVQNVQMGKSQPIRFQFQGSVGNMDEKMSASSITTTIDLPEVCFVNVLQYLDGREITNLSLVSKVWSSVSKNPIVWEDGVDMSRFNLDKKLNMTSFLKLLGLPQFSMLKALALPYNVKVGKNSVKQLAKLLPHLEVFDGGYYSQNAKCTDTDLLAATEYFTQLNSLRTDMSKVTSSGIGAAVRAMGERLVDLRVFADTIARHYPSGMTMEAIISCCPNLKYFAYRTCNSSSYYDPNLDWVTGDCIVRLVEACRRLETLELSKAYHVKQSHFVQIAKMVANKLHEFALRTMKVIGYAGVNPSGTIDKCCKNPFNIREVLRPFTFLRIEDKFFHSRLENGIMFWSKYGDDRVERDRSKMMLAFSNKTKQEIKQEKAIQQIDTLNQRANEARDKLRALGVLL